MRVAIFIALPLLLLSACRKDADQASLDHFCQNYLSQWNHKLTQVVMTDIFTPPVCSRIYAYTNIAAYEALCPGNPAYKTYAGRLNDLNVLPKPDDRSSIYSPVASAIAFATVAQKLVFNGDAIVAQETFWLHQLDSIGMNKALKDKSVAFGRAVGQHIIEWASRDGYLQRTALGGYIVSRDPGRWMPTPPDYMDAVEPNWKTLRPFTLETAAQFRPPAPMQFDSTPGSGFYKQAMVVYETVKKLNAEQKAIAKFWDCNPNVSTTQGHIMVFDQKISPGGHWVFIAAKAAEDQQLDAPHTAALLSKTAIAIADAFISCWEGKYATNLLRPETYINRYVDKDWKPMLQTPPFPEYTSGHSVASASAATVLTAFLGENHAFMDSTEISFGMPPRQFPSFQAAAKEASISRLYGGIHYLPALEMGAEQGKKVGEWVLKHLK